MQIRPDYIEFHKLLDWAMGQKETGAPAFRPSTQCGIRVPQVAIGERKAMPYDEVAQECSRMACRMKAFSVAEQDEDSGSSRLMNAIERGVQRRELAQLIDNDLQNSQAMQDLNQLQQDFLNLLQQCVQNHDQQVSTLSRPHTRDLERFLFQQATHLSQKNGIDNKEACTLLYTLLSPVLETFAEYELDGQPETTKAALFTGMTLCFESLHASLMVSECVHYIRAVIQHPDAGSALINGYLAQALKNMNAWVRCSTNPGALAEYARDNLAQALNEAAANNADSAGCCELVRSALDQQCEHFNQCGAAVAQPVPALPFCEDLTKEVYCQTQLVNERGFQYLEQQLGKDVLSCPDTLECYRNFHSLKGLCPDLGLDSFVHLWRCHGRNWFMNIPDTRDPAQYYQARIPFCRQALAICAEKNGQHQMVLDLIQQLDIEGLSTPGLKARLNAVDKMVDAWDELYDPFESVNDLVVTFNTHLFYKNTLRQIQASSDPAVLCTQLQELARAGGAYVRRANSRQWNYNNNGATMMTGMYGLEIQPTQENGDCLYYAFAKLLGCPMRQIRMQCHITAQAVIAKRLGAQPVAVAGVSEEAIEAAAQGMDINYLKQQVTRQRYLKTMREISDPEGEQGEQWGSTHDLALIALSLNRSVVGLLQDNDYLATSGYNRYGRHISDCDRAEHAIDQLTEYTAEGLLKPLVVVLCDGHWEAARYRQENEE